MRRERIRKEGGGRKPLTEKYPRIKEHISYAHLIHFMAWQSGRQTPPASQIEIRQSEHDVQLGALLFQTSVSGFPVTEQIFHDAKGMLHFGADGRLLFFPTFDLSAAAGAVVPVLRRPAVDFILYLLAFLVPENRVLPFLRANISAVPVDALLFSMKKFNVTLTSLTFVAVVSIVWTSPLSLSTPICALIVPRYPISYLTGITACNK